MASVAMHVDMKGMLKFLKAWTDRCQASLIHTEITIHVDVHLLDTGAINNLRRRIFHVMSDLTQVSKVFGKSTAHENIVGKGY